MKPATPDQLRRVPGNSALARLSEAQRAELYAWLNEAAPGHGYDGAVAKCAAWGVKVTRTPVWKWHRRQLQADYLERREKAAQWTQDRDAPADVDRQTRSLLNELLAQGNAALVAGCDPESVKTIVEMATGLIQANATDRRVGQSGESLRLAREKFEAQERRNREAREALTRAAERGGLSAEARAEIEKAMGLL